MMSDFQFQLKLWIGSLLATIVAYWKPLLIIGGLIAVLLFFGWFFNACDSVLFWRGIKREQENVNALNANAANTNAAIENLRQQDAAKQAEVNIRKTDYNTAQNRSDNARTETNTALENVGKIESGDYSNTNLTEAEKARCRAFPARCQ